MTLAMEAAPQAVAQQQPEADLPKLMRFVDGWASQMDPALRQSLQCCEFFDGVQVTDNDRQTLFARGQPVVIINRIKPAVNGMVGIVEKGRTDPKGIPRVPTTEDNANLATDVLRYISDYNRQPSFKRLSFTDMAKAGWTASITEIDDDGEVVTKRIRWEEFIWDPASRELDLSDARFVGVAKWKYVDDVQAEYPDLKDQIAGALSANASLSITTEDRPFGGWGWVDTKSRRVMVVELYHKENGQWLRCKFVRSVALEYGPSGYLDKRGRPRNPIEGVRAYVDTQNRPYGVVLDMLDPQREINARRSWMLRALVVRQAMVQPGAVADKEVLRAELAKTDGIIETQIAGGVEILDRNLDIAGHAQLLQEAKSEIDRQAPNPALQGREQASLSGRASLLRQQAGLLEQASVLGSFEDYELRVYRQQWQCAVQFWTAPKYIRVTKDTKAPEHLLVNEPVVEEQMDPMTGQMTTVPKMEPITDPRTGQPVIDPQTGQPAMRPVMNRHLAELDVDITIDTSPDVANVEQEQFQALTDLFPAVVQLGDPAKSLAILEGIIASSSVIRDKAGLIEKLTSTNEPSPEQQAQKQLQMEGAKQEVRKTASEADKNEADAMKTHAETAHMVIEGVMQDAGVDGASEDRQMRRDDMAAKREQQKKSTERV